MFTMREIAVIFDPERKLFLNFGVTFLAIVAGPFGTYDAMVLWERTIFWTLDILGAAAIIAPITHIFYHSKLMVFIPSILRFMLGVTLGALPASAYITVLYSTVGSGFTINVPFPLLFLQVTVFSIILLLVEFVLWPLVFGSAGPRIPQTVPAPMMDGMNEPDRQGAALLTRLPEKFRNGEIISISMQDHYAEITTTEGQALILMRLNDAIDLVRGCPGARIHRSHWVARKYVARVVRNDRSMDVLLIDGRRLPIGNTFLKDAQQHFVTDEPEVIAGTRANS